MTEDQTQADPIADVLRAAPTSDRVRATAWDAFYAASDPDDFATRIKDLPLSDEVKAALWDAKSAGRPEMNFATVNGQDVDVDKRNDLGTFASHVWQQVNPVAAIRGIGKALIPEAAARAMGVEGDAAEEYGPLNTLSHLGAAQGAVFDKAKDAYAKGNTLEAARHFASYLIPVAGPVLDRAADEMQEGRYMAGLGDTVGLGAGIAVPGMLPKGGAVRGPVRRLNATEAESNAFAKRHGIPLDAATATGSRTLRAMEKRAANSMGGEGTAERLIQDQQAALQRVGGELADDAHPATVTPDQAGQGVRDRLSANAKGQRKTADAAYGRLRELENDPSMRVGVPLTPKAVDLLDDSIRGELRRIVHEMDAMPFTPRVLRESGVGGSLEHVPGTGGAGAKVFDDILARMDGTSSPTRGTVQQQLEDYLGGGKETSAVRAAREVAEARALRRNATGISSPQLSPSAKEVPTRLEKARVKTEEIGLPVNTEAAKEALRPVYEQLTRQMPITQQQANPGLKAIANILDGPDWAPLSQVDRDLSTIKKLAREKGGVAKLAVKHLEDAVQEAARMGGDEVTNTLQKGRAATVAKAQTQTVAKALRGGPMQEPVAVYRQLTAPKDSAITLLQKVKQQAPGEIEKISRGYLEDLLGHATAKGGFSNADKLWADWQRLGPRTKAVLFPKPGQVKALDQFFLLAKRIGENPNPSGTAHTLNATNLLSTVWTFPLAKLLYTPKGVSALTRLLQAESSPMGRAARRVAPGPGSMAKTARSTALADLVLAAKEAGVEITVPKAAGPQRESPREPAVAGSSSQQSRQK